MKTILYIFGFIAILVMASFTLVKRDCHIVFGVSSKLRIIDQSKDGNSRLYSNQKETFKLEISRFSSKTPHETLHDSMNVWISGCKANLTNSLLDMDTFQINDIPIHNLNYKCAMPNGNWVNNIFGFSSNSHFYRMHISYPSARKEKGEREMSKIISSLNIHCN